ncbi:L-fucose:H+ symporter permease [Fulvitalea axinellae]
MLIPFILLTSCFAWWGLANNMTDTLLAAFKKIKSMTDFETSLIQMAFYGSYFCFALPAALFIRKYSFKSGVLLGLGLFITGGLLFYPASITQEYYHFLAALYVLAGGLSILETSANPYMMVMGPKGTATQRLNLAQSFNPIGSIAGVVISKLFILSQLRDISEAERLAMAPEALKAVQTEELAAVMNPYVTVSVILILTWILIAVNKKMPKASDSGTMDLKKSFASLFSNKDYIFGVLAQFFYVGAQIGVWSYTIRYVMTEIGLNEADSATYYIISLVCFASFRFIGTALMSRFKPSNILITKAVTAGILTCLVMFVGGTVGVYALVGISACMSIMFPTIFGLSLETVEDENIKLAGSGQIMTILGGAVLTALQGVVSDATGSIRLSFLVPLACFVIILLFGYKESRKAKA